MIATTVHRLRQSMALLLVMLLLPIQALAQSGASECGRITALLPSASRNKKLASVQEKLQWQDLLNTDASGRLRANLQDGSILSLGRDSHLVVVKHDADLQQTSLQLNYGRLRSQVAVITRSGGRFELRTPVAVVGVIGTDFYVYTTADLTVVICYSGTLSVTPIAGAVAGVSSSTQPLTLKSGEVVEIRGGVPGNVETLTNAVRDETIAETHVAETTSPIVQRSWFARHKHLVIGIGAAAVAGAVVAATTGSSGSSSETHSHPY